MNCMKNRFEVTRNAGRISISLSAVRMGTDLCVALFGGDKPHIGAVALSQSRPSLDDAEKTSASTSVIPLLGHKEDQLARDVAKRLACKMKANVSVACGVHLDDITADEIDTVCKLTLQAVDKLVKLLELSPGK